MILRIRSSSMGSPSPLAARASSLLIVSPSEKVRPSKRSTSSSRPDRAPRHHRIPGLQEAGFLDHRDVFSLEAIPKELVVIGGGPIGCELGQALSRLGSVVSIFQRSGCVLAREDPDVSQVVLDAFKREGIGVFCDSHAEQVSQRGGRTLVRAKVRNRTTTVTCDAVLVAVGRRPNIDSLNLEAAGVVYGDRGITVDETLATNQSHIYAVGDCNGGPQFTHWAEHEARIATRNALFKGSAKRDARQLPRVTFTDPEVASVGLTLEQARERRGGAHEHRVNFGAVDRARCESAVEGFVKIVVDRKDKILGAHAVGHLAGELLAEIVSRHETWHLTHRRRCRDPRLPDADPCDTPCRRRAFLRPRARRLGGPALRQFRSRKDLMRASMIAGTVALLLGAPTVRAEEGPPHGEPRGPGAHHEEYPNLVGFRAGYLGASEPEEGGERLFRSFIFLGLSYERTLIHEWLEAEISVPVAISFGRELHVAMPFDLHLKIPFHPAPEWSPYLAVGPSMDLLLKPETLALFGVSFAAGTYVWFSDQVGLDIELDYNLIVDEGELVHEFLVASGPVLRF